MNTEFAEFGNEFDLDDDALPPIKLTEEELKANEEEGNSPAVTSKPVSAANVVAMDALTAQAQEDGEYDASPDEQLQAAITPAAPIIAEEMPSLTKEEISELSNARQWGMLVSLSTSQWSGRIKDYAAAEEVARIHGATSKAFNVQKNLLANADSDLNQIKSAFQRARMSYYHMTLPWGRGAHATKGARLLPNTLYFSFIQDMSLHRNAIKALVQTFVSNYNTLVSAALINLGTAADASLYPKAEDIASMFAFEFDFAPIPQGGDFSGLPPEHLDKLAEVVNNKMVTLAEAAMKDAWSRLYDTLNRLHEKLTGDNVKLHRATIDACTSMAEHLGHLNFTKDARLDDIRSRVRSVVGMYDPKEVQKDKDLRKVLAEKVKVIMDDIQKL